MLKIIGVLFILFGIIVHLFFTHYDGTLIPYPPLMHLLGIALIPTGIVFILYGSGKMNRQDQSMNTQAHHHLKDTGEKIIVDLDNCDFKSNSYEVEIPDMRTQYDSFEGPEHRMQTENIQQSMFTYIHLSGSKTESFQSPIFPIDLVSLKTHIIKKELVLYVDRKDRSNYYFELNDLNVSVE
jgi:hypothetical protein